MADISGEDDAATRNGGKVDNLPSKYKVSITILLDLGRMTRAAGNSLFSPNLPRRPRVQPLLDIRGIPFP
jgi:hypothetical protein